MEPVAATQAGVVADVPGALLQVAHQSTPFEDLGQDVRRLLAGEVHAAQLGYGVIAVFEEHLFVKVLCPFEADRGVDRLVTLDIEFSDKLVKEQPPEALRAAAVPGEQRTLDDFREIDQRKNWAVEVSEISTKYVDLGLTEVLGDVDGHGVQSYGAGVSGPWT